MSMFKCLVPCKIAHHWTAEGQVIELSDKSVITHLKNNNAIEPTTESKSLTSVQELEKVKGVNARLAAVLVENGVTTVDKLSAHTVEQLMQIEGINKKTAETIFSAFVI